MSATQSGSPGKALRDARPGAQVPTGRLDLTERRLGLVDRLVAVALADLLAAAAAGGEGEGGRGENTGNEEGRQKRGSHIRSIPAGTRAGGADLIPR